MARRQHRLVHMLSGWGGVLSLVALLAAGAPAGLRAQTAVSLPFVEGFEDANWDARGWYDSPSIQTSGTAAAPEGTRACHWRWSRAGDTLPGGKGGRVLFEPCEGLTFSYWVRFSEDWAWTGLGWHPHMFMFMTNLNGMYDGPAWSHLTIYSEAVDGRLRFALQDGENIDAAHVGEDLTQVTENRAVAGGNGSSDGYPTDYYLSGTVYANDKIWDSDSLYLSNAAGPYNKSGWHRMKVHFQLNSVVDGKGINNGVFRWWMDGRLMLDYEDVLFRTGAFPSMKINQFMMLPYLGPGAKNPESVWVDDLHIEREEELLPVPAPGKFDFDGNGRAGFRDALEYLVLSVQDRSDPRLDRNRDGSFDILDTLDLLRQLFGLRARFGG
ncbi:hypothetical protein LLH00_05770 [bacterium]|nr:hypothetical protein [bacterium]